MWRGQAWSGRKVFDPSMPFRRTKSLSVGAQESEVGPYRLAIVISHPVHYQVPLFRKLAANPEFDLTVYFCSRDGVEHTFDEDFAGHYKWDLPLLEGYRHFFLKNWSLKPRLGRFFGLCNFGILRELSPEKHDAVLIHGYNYATTLLALCTARLRGMHTLFRGETVLRPQTRWIIRLPKTIVLKIVFWASGAFLTIGSMSTEFYKRYGISSDRLFYTPYCVDNERLIKQCDEYRPVANDLKASLGLDPRLPVILYVGKLTEKKRPYDLMTAFRQVSDRASLVFVGDGPLRSTLESAVRSSKNVRILGFTSQREIPKYYAMADVFALPSSEMEVSPLVVNEAMCAGLPVIISDAVPSAKDFVRNGVNGFRYPMGNIQRLEQFLGLLVDDSKLRADFGRVSREMVSAWNYQACVDGIHAALEFLRTRS